MCQAQNIVLNLVEQTHQFCHFMTLVAHRRVAVHKGQILMTASQQQTDIFLDDPIELLIQLFDKMPNDTLVYAIGNQVGAGQEILELISTYRQHG